MTPPIADARPATLPGYDLAPPCEADAVHALRRHFGVEEAERLWAAACRAVGVRRTGGALLPADLEPIAAHLAAGEGLQRAVGQSLGIRCRTYRVLAARRTTPLGLPAIPARPAR